MKMIIVKKSLFRFFVLATLLVLFFSISPATVRADGVLAISTDAATPLASNIAPGASNVELTRIDFSTSGAGTILGIALNLQTAHLGNVADFKIYDLATATQIGTINVIDFSGNGYTGAISFPIAANVTKILSIKADISTTAVVGDVIRVGLNNVVASGWNNITGFTTNQTFGNPMTITGTGTPLTITTSSPLPNAQVGLAYSTTLMATGAISGNTYNWSISSGSLPPGLSLGNVLCTTSSCANPPAGMYAINGTPTTAGTYTFTMSAQTGSQSTSKQFTLTVDSSAVTTNLVASLDVASPLSATIAPGVSNANVGTFKISTGSAGTTITSMTFGMNRSANFCPGSNYRLYDMSSGTQIGQTSYTDSGCNFSFDNLNYVIPANSSKSVSVKLDLSSETIAGTFAVYLAHIGTSAGDNVGGLPVIANTMTVSTTPDDLQFSVATDKLTYKPDEKIQITIYAINNSTQAKVLNFNSGCQVSYAISSLFDSAKGALCTRNLTSVSIAPQSKNLWSIVHTPELYRLQDGVYSLTGRVIGYGESKTSFNVTASEVPQSSQNQKPLGWLDSISKDGFISGWALDLDHLDVPINIHVYFDGPTGGKGGPEPTAAATDVQRDDVNLIMQATGTHGFKIALPGTLYDGKKHTAYVYAIDIDDSSGASNAQLWGSPKTFSLKSNNAARHPRGTVVLGEGATVYFLGAELRYAFPSPDVFFSWGHQFSELVLANAADLAIPIGPVAGLKQ